MITLTLVDEIGKEQKRRFVGVKAANNFIKRMHEKDPEVLNADTNTALTLRSIDGENANEVATFANSLKEDTK